MNNNNKKRLFIAAIFLLLLFLLMTFAGGNTEVAVVEFIDGFDDSVIDTQQVEIGEDAKVPEDPKHKNFVFAGWYLFSDHDVKVTDFTNIEEDLKVIALYAGDRNNNGIDDDKDEVYTVTFIDGFNDSVIKTEDVLVGMDAQAPEAPTHRGYTFIGWDKGYTNITVDTEVTAEYNRNEVQVTTYTVTFIDGETNEVITTQNVREGNTATLPTPPVHENRVFVSWEGDYTNVNSNRTITATYTDDKNNNGIEDETEAHYDITYVDYNDEILEVIEDVLVDTLTPTIEDPQRENYEFKGWEPSVSEYVTGNATYKAEYTPINDENNNNVADEEEEHYTIIYNDYDGRLIQKFENVLVDTETPTIENPTREYYTFEKWNPEVAELVKEDATYVASYTINNDVDNDGVPDETENKYTVNYYLISENDETAYKTFTDLVEGVKTPIVEKPTREFYEFVKWKPEVAETVTKDINYVAQWDAKNDEDDDNIADEEEFKIEFIIDNKVVKTEYLLEGEMPTAPTVEDTNEDNRVFAGWDSEIVSATEDKQYIAQFKEDLDNDGYADEDQYKVEFVLDGEVLDTQYLNEDELPKVPIVPQEIYPEKKVFDKWTPEIVANYEGQYIGTWTDDLNNNGEADKDETKFTITYLNKDGSEFAKFENQLKGLTTPQPENNPTAEGFVFDGWDGVKPTIEGNATYESKWLVDSDKDGIADEDEFKIEFIVDREVVKTEYLTEGQNPTAPTVTDTNEDNRVFVKWNPEIVAATENAQYTAEFAEDLNNNGEADKEETKYTIKYLNKDGSVFKEFNNQLKGLATPQPENKPVAEGFVFDGWDGVKPTIEGNATYESKWLVDSDKDGIADENEHEIKFIVDGKVVKIEYLSDNEMPTAPSMDEYDTEDDERVFANWKPEVVAATADAEYEAQFKDDVNNDGKADEDQFLIEFYNKDEFVSSDYYNEGETVVAPTLEDPKNDGETHTGWDPEFKETASASVRYDAVWETDIDNDNIADESEHEIKFIVDGKVVKTEYLSDNEMPTAPSMDKYDTENDKRVFANWKPEVVAATADAEYEAQFKDDVNNDGTADEEQFLIEFYSKNEFVSSDYYNEGETVVEPTLADTDKDGEVHTGWNPEFNSTATASVRYDAVWDKDIDNDGVADKDQLLVQFVANNQTILSDYVTKGEPTPMPNPNDIPTVAGKAFYGWNPTVSDKVEVAVTYEALYGDDTDNDGKADITEIKIEFNINDELYETQYLQLNEMPVAPTPTKKGYILSAWTPKIENVTGPQVYNATWLVDSNDDGYADENQFLIEFYNKDEFVTSDYYNKGETVVAPTLTDTKEDGETHTGWDPEFNSTATASVRYDAVWETDIDNDNIADESEHEIKFIVDGQVVKTEYLSDNEMPTAPSMDEYDTEDDERVFDNWKPEVVAATADAEYEAQFKDDVNNDGTADEEQFLIEFYNKDEFVTSDYYNEGETVVAPTLEDPKNDGETHTGWDPEFNSTASASVRYDAVWETDTDNDNVADEDEFTIEFIVDGQVVDTQYLIKDEMPVSPNMEQYDTNSDSRVFAEWNPTLAPATADQQYEAVFTADINNDGIADSEQTLWTVKFYGNDNTTVISEQIVVDGQAATAPTAPTKTGYTFKNWDKEYSNVTSNLDVYPVFADETAPEVSLSSELQSENTEAKIIISATDLGSGVKTIKYALGSKEESDFADISAISTTNFVVNINGVYTVYVEDNAGNVTLKEIEITGIELAPSDEENTEFKDEYVTIKMSRLRGLWLPLIGTLEDYKLDFTLTANPETGAKIKTVKYHQGDFINGRNNYESESHFDSECSRDKVVYSPNNGNPIDEITINLTTPYPDRFTIYVVYELDGKEYTRLYKVRLAQILSQ